MNDEVEVKTTTNTSIEEEEEDNTTVKDMADMAQTMTKDNNDNCDVLKSQIFLTQLPKLITISNDASEPTILSSYEVKETTKYYCIQASQVLEYPQLEKPTEVVPVSQNEATTTEANPKEIITTTEENTTTSDIVEDDEDYVTESEREDYENASDESDIIYKTLYTTYTYLTTFFQADATTISSHTEIVTNIITSTLDMELKSSIISENEIIATTTTKATNLQATKYMIPDDLKELIDANVNNELKHDSSESSQKTEYLNDVKYTKTFYTTFTYYTTIFAESETEIMSRTEVFTNYVTELGAPMTSVVQLAKEIVINPTETESTSNADKLVTLITDVKSSSSNGEQHLKIRDDMADDQISSESNTEEMLPSATLLLQTSFTTFTFYTTMYEQDSTNVVSRLETVTNIATETLQPTKMPSHAEDATLPITYFTTFTYWTKLAKDGEITTISREETISNVIEPTKIWTENSSETLSKSTTANSTASSTGSLVNLITQNASDLTTFYTTYTYYTTSYKANQTVTDSRFETIVNVITPTATIISSVDSLPVSSIVIDKSELLYYDYKHIIDADGVSTLYFTTQIQSSIDSQGSAIELTSSTSSLLVDESKKLELNSVASSSQYKTGLVRLIEGTRVGNRTTTLYQSKVIGTIIDSRYAQIIESTSSFLFEKNISPSATIDELIVKSTKQLSQLSQQQIETATVESSMHSEEQHDNDGDGDNDSDGDSNLSSQSKKRTFAPVIRPFASRNRPTFAPKQKTLSASSATIITRSDITPTITATPALKSVGGARYSSSRRGAISNAPINPQGAAASSTRRLFGRPLKSSVVAPASAGGLSSSVAGSTTGFAPSRNRFASSARSGTASSSRRLSSGSASTSASGYRPASSVNFLNSRQRIRPTAAFGQALPASTTTTPATAAENEPSEEDASTEEETSIATDDNEEKTAQNSRRTQNPLLRFRRPLNRPSGFTPATRVSNTSATNVSVRKNPLASRAKAATTTTTTTTTVRPRPRSFQRPTLSSLQARARPQNNLFPPRGLFQQQREKEKTQAQDNDSDGDADYDDDEDGDEEDQETAQNGTIRRRRRHSNKKSVTLSRRRRQVDTLSRNRFRFRRPKTATTEETPAEEQLAETTTTTRSRLNARFGSRYKQQSSSTAATAAHRAIRPTRPTTARAQFTLREKDTAGKSRQAGAGSSAKSNFRRPQSALRRSGSGSGSSSNSGSNSSSGSSFNSKSANARRLKNYISSSNNNNNNSRTASNPRSRTGTGSGTSSRNRNANRNRNRNDYNQDVASAELGSVAITVTHLVPAEVTVPVVNGQLTEYKNIVTAKTSLEVLAPHQYTQQVGSNGQTSLYLVREDTSVNAAGVTELTRYLLHDTLTTTVTFTPTTIRGRKTSFSHVLPSTVYGVESVVSTLQPQIAANAPLANILLSQLLLGNINLPANPLLGALAGTQPALPALDAAVAATTAAAAVPVTEYRTHTSTYVTTIYDGKSTILPITFQGKKILTTVFDTTAQTITATEYSVDTIVNTPTQQFQQLQQQSGQVAQVNSLLLQQLLFQQQQQQQLQPQQQQNPAITNTISPQILLNDNLQDLDEITPYDAPNIEGIIVEQQTTSKSHKKSRKPGKSHKRHRQHKEEDREHHTESSVVTLYVSGRRPGEFSTILSTVYSSYEHLTPSTLHKRHAQQTISLAEDLYAFEGSERVQSYLPAPVNKNTLGELDQTASLESIIGDVHLWYAKAKATQELSAPSSSRSNSNLAELSLDEARFNLATHVMSNGVELIIASDKLKHQAAAASASVSASAVTQFQSQSQLPQKPVTLAPSTLKNHMILALPTNNKQTPELVVGTFPTTYHFYNTLRNNGLVLSSTYTVMNTVTGPEDYISYLQPSEEATPVLDTNTYYSRLAVTRTAPNGILTDSENVLTQLVITESKPGRGNPKVKAASSEELDVHIFATKTYLTTVTYLATTSIYHASTDSQGVSNFETKVIVNTITDIVPSTLLRPELVSMFRTELMQKKGKNNRKVLVTLATLLGGQTLQVTAVNLKKTTTNQISSTLIKPTSIKSKPTKTQSKNDELQVDLSVAESQNEPVYVRPLKEVQATPNPNPTSVEQLIGSLNLQRLRPVFDVMADIIQKNIVNRQATTNLNLRQTSTSTTTENPLEEQPVYIPLEVSVQQKAAQNRYKSHANKAEIDINRSRLTAHSLHINPPEPAMQIDFNDDDNWLLHNNNMSHILSPLSIYPTYPGALLNNGIPIRPGEIINANADVIIGRPNGILHSPQAQFMNSSPRPKNPPDYSDRSIAPFKKKTWIPPQPVPLSLSLTPPRLIPLDYDNILFPPAQSSSKSQPDFGYILTPPGSAPRLPQQQIMHLNAELNNNEILEIKAIPQIFSTKLPAVTRYPALVAGSSSSYYNQRPVNPSVYSDNAGSGSYYSAGPATAAAYADINGSGGTSFYKQGTAPANTDMGGSSSYYTTEPAPAPPAYSDMGSRDSSSYYKPGHSYSEKGGSNSNSTPRPSAALLAAPAAYSDMGGSNSGSYYNPGPTTAAPPAPPAYATHHINLKTSVLNHNINMNVPPLTFKREGDNYPLATAVRGQIAPAPMPLIKIPHNKANVEVRLSPQNTRIAVEPPEKLREGQNPNINTFKQRNQNYLKNTDNVRSDYVNSTLHLAPYQRPTDKYSFINNKNANQQQYISTISSDSVQAATNLIRAESSKQSYASPSTTSNKVPVPDQKTDYTSHSDHNYNLTLSKVNRHIQNLQLPTSKLTPINPWLSITQQTANKTPSLGQPFIKSNQSPANKPKINIPKKVFVGAGQRFNLLPGLKLETTTTQYIEDLQLLTSIRPTNILEPPPMPINSLHQDVLGMKPPPAIIKNIPNRSSSVVYKIKTSALPATPSIIISTLQLQLNNSFNTESQILKPALSSSRFKVLKSQPTFTKTLPKTLSINGTSKQQKMTVIKTEGSFNNVKQHSTQHTNIVNQHSTQQKINPTKIINQHSTQKKINPTNNIKQHSTNLKLSPTNAINQHSTVIKLSPTNIVQQHSTQLQLSPAIEPAVLPTNINSINTKKLNIYQQATLKNTQIIPNQNQSNLLSLESSEAETKKIPFSIRSNAPHFDVSFIDRQITKQLYDKSISTLNKNIATQSVVLKSSSTPIIKSRIIDTKSITFKPIQTHSITKQTISKTIRKSENPVKTTSTKIEQVHSDISNILVVMKKGTGADNQNTINLAEEEEELALDYEGNLSLEIPLRDEEIVPPINANSILLGGILIATPSKTNTKSKYTKESSNGVCQPACKANKNEICSSQPGHGNDNRCECRLGFARMFPDRPCKHFDECGNANFNDCSFHAHCFNLIGSYTCSCLDGYVDISDNPIYPGRLCSDQIVGCELCNYHGNCMAPIVNGTPVCECFSWHSGATCQLNLKILLIGLIAIGTVFILLLVCMLLIYSRHKVNGACAARPIFITSSNYHPSMLSTSSNKSLIRDCSMDKHAILIDTNSESSHNSEPYSFKVNADKIQIFKLYKSSL
ncbi:GH23949 [Drosophila grimshawi]|uniref:GH23949 n=1 Tax=Drosophila grimshawi TaxID=7222 RepID=B4JZS2_DROGR|nr:GH23949 [Drosophila grimshawi]